MNRTHKITLAPSWKQGVLFAQHAGYACIAYNHALADFKAGLDEGEWRNDRMLRPRFKGTIYKAILACASAERSGCKTGRSSRARRRQATLKDVTRRVGVGVQLVAAGHEFVSPVASVVRLNRAIARECLRRARGSTVISVRSSHSALYAG